MTVTTKAKYTAHTKTTPINANTLNSNPLTPASLEITIEDTGCGIAKEDLPYVFDPFYSRKDGGTGLGLSITHGIIEQHKGKIRVESEVSMGTRFIVELPISEEKDKKGN